MNTLARWYVIHAYSGFEHKVADSIKEQAAKLGLSEMIEEISVPTQEIVEVKRGARVNTERKFFPGYILIKMALTPKAKYVVENTQGVMSFVGPKGGTPVPLREVEVKRIFGEVERKEGREVLVTPFKKDDHVKIIAGPFIDFSGVVEELNDDKQKVKVVISIFGRPTPVELDYFQVEMEK